MSIGGNDAWLDESRPEVRAMVSEVCAAGGERFYWLDLSLPGIRRWHEPAALWRACAASTIAVEDDLPFQVDQVHLTSSGYRQLAALIVGQLF
jgi:lysophospholipase L1-like esterase